MRMGIEHQGHEDQGVGTRSEHLWVHSQRERE